MRRICVLNGGGGNLYPLFGLGQGLLRKIGEK